MAVVRKKQDDKHLKTLREIVSLGGNKQCFDCGQRGPTYVNMTIGSFVCTRCSGLLRGITPPHRVKSISMATFSSDEIEFIRSHGNDTCAKTWLGLWDPKRVLTQDQRDLMVDKYERKRYFLEPASPLKSLPQHTSQTGMATLLNGLHASKGSQSPIALTPPASLRLAASTRTATATPAAKGNGNGTTNSTTNPIPAAQTASHQFHTQFTPDDQPAGMFALKPQAISNGSSSNNNNSPNLNGKPKTTFANGITRHGMSGLSGSQATNGDRTAARLSGPPVGQYNNNNNGSKFTPDGDFGSDFGTFGGVKGAAVANGQRNGGGDNANADFADFEHNAIFNAAAPTESQNTAPSFAFNSTSAIVNNNPMQSAATNQWNVWQQFQLPHVPPEQNRWSLPMSLSSTSAGSLNSSGSTPFNSSSSSINSTPPVDRYAALKDLDMQLREVVKDTGLFTSNSSNGNGTATISGGTNGISNGNTANEANPFKAHHHQFGGVPQQPQPQQVPNPFQPAQTMAPTAAAVPNGPQGWATDFGSAAFANSATQQQQQQQQQQLMQQQYMQQQQLMHQQQQQHLFSAGTNGFGGLNNGFHLPNVMQANGGTAGFGIMQRNPFAATTTGGAAVRSNNPFL